MAEPYVTMTPRGRFDTLATCSCGWSELCKSEWTAQDRAGVHFREAHPPPAPASAPDAAALLFAFERFGRAWFERGKMPIAAGELLPIREAFLAMLPRIRAGESAKALGTAARAARAAEQEAGR